VGVRDEDIIGGDFVDVDGLCQFVGGDERIEKEGAIFYLDGKT
jgi:hypothetical protein